MGAFPCRLDNSQLLPDVATGTMAGGSSLVCLPAVSPLSPLSSEDASWFQSYTTDPRSLWEAREQLSTPDKSLAFSLNQSVVCN